LTRDQYRDKQAANAKKPNAGLDGMQGPDFKSTNCDINKAANKQSKKDWKKK